MTPMYLSHYGLAEAPFELTPDPRFLFLTPTHREALANLEYGLATFKPITLIIGEAGTGKTTLLRTALQSQASRRVHGVHLNNPALSPAEFVEMIARQFQLSDAATKSKAVLLSELESTLRERRDNGETAALVIDEAQRLSDDLLEEIRLLANIETDTHKLLPLVLVGQPALGERLNQPGLRQLKQRVALRCVIQTFSFAETATYIAHRLHFAGGEAGRIFTREAVTLVHECSRGIPRSINVLCDNALLAAFADGHPRVTRDVVEEVARDFDFTRADAAVGPAGEDSAGASAAAPRTVPFRAAAAAEFRRAAEMPKRFLQRLR